MEESGFEYHLLSPVWTEEQTAAIYAVDQFESFSSPYTKEANMSNFKESSWLLLSGSEVFHSSFLQITEQNQ